MIFFSGSKQKLAVGIQAKFNKKEMKQMKKHDMDDGFGDIERDRGAGRVVEMTAKKPNDKTARS